MFLLSLLRSKTETGLHKDKCRTTSSFHSLSVNQRNIMGVRNGSNDPAMNKPVGGSRAPIRLPSLGY